MNVMGKKPLTLFVILVALSFPVEGVVKKRDDAKEATGESTGVILWRNPTDIATRNLFYGPGGREHQPHSQFTFLKEGLNGTNPKCVVRDQDGVKWKVKLGAGARPEAVASRLPSRVQENSMD